MQFFFGFLWIFWGFFWIFWIFFWIYFVGKGGHKKISQPMSADNFLAILSPQESTKMNFRRFPTS